MAEVSLLMLGCGASTGVPIIGCDCKVCTSSDPKNRRTRASVLFETQGKNILVDTSPDVRIQALREGVTRLDAVIYTHDHADHTHGIDEIKAFNVQRQGVVPAYGDAASLASIQGRFAYAFKPPVPEFGWYRPALEAHEIASDGEHAIAGVTVRTFSQIHGRHQSLGVRIGPIAYTTDANDLSEAAFAALQGVEIWVVDCLRYRPAPTHAHLERTLEWIARVKPRLAVLTHMAHEIDYHGLKAQLPEGVVPGYDGLRLASN